MATRKKEDPFSAQYICKALVKEGYISKGKATSILKKSEGAMKKLVLEKRKKEITAPVGQRIENPVTMIDAIQSMNVEIDDKEKRPLDEEMIFFALTKAWDFPYKKIDPLELDLNFVTTKIPRSFAMKHLVLPIEIKDGSLVVATPDPFNREAMEDVTRATGMNVSPVVSTKSDIIKLIDEFFGFKRSIAAAEDQFTAPSVDLGNLEQYVKLKSADDLQLNDNHIVNAVNHLLGSSFEQRASDIHIEPKRDETHVRMRIDGMLHTVYKLPKKVHFAIVSRIKAMSRLDVAEKRRPQDGRMKIDKEGVEVEIRISTVPVAFGEKVVMRLMDPDVLFQDIRNLGLTDEDYSRYEHFVSQPHGIMLITGPTGSGKSTTLYSTLRSLASPDVNITTVEDPIEMVHDEFNQIAVHRRIGITFSSILRNILRQDPDIIMLGEMRDLETAEQAVQAALTGHLVLSTLHTNDAPSSITRLLDLGVPSFLIQATLIGIVAQRLVRKVCGYCREIFEMDPSELKAMGLDMGGKKVLQLHHGKGCLRCRGTGYLGRTGIYEVLPYSTEIRRLTSTETDIEILKARAIKEGMTTLRENAVKKMIDGDTTYHEVLRVTMENL